MSGCPLFRGRCPQGRVPLYLIRQVPYLGTLSIYYYNNYNNHAVYRRVETTASAMSELATPTGDPTVTTPSGPNGIVVVKDDKVCSI